MCVLGRGRASVDRSRGCPRTSGRHSASTSSPSSFTLLLHHSTHRGSTAVSMRFMEGARVTAGLLGTMVRPRVRRLALPLLTSGPSEDKRLRPLRLSTRRATRCGFPEPVPRRRSVVETGAGARSRQASGFRRTASFGSFAASIASVLAGRPTDEAKRRKYVHKKRFNALPPPCPHRRSRTAPSGPRPPSSAARPR